MAVFAMTRRDVGQPDLVASFLKNLGQTVVLIHNPFDIGTDDRASSQKSQPLQPLIFGACAHDMHSIQRCTSTGVKFWGGWPRQMRKAS
jgi:hypothetical protein